VRVVGAPNEVQIYLNQSYLKSSTDFLLPAFYFYIGMLKKLLFYLILLTFKKKKKIKKVRVLVVSMILGKKKANDIEDHFFGKIFSGLRNKKQENLGWLYINPSLRNDGFKKLNLHRIYCGTAATNAGMKKIALNLGMKEEVPANQKNFIK
jgi:hypothetical protein